MFMQIEHVAQLPSCCKLWFKLKLAVPSGASPVTAGVEAGLTSVIKTPSGEGGENLFKRPHVRG